MVAKSFVKTRLEEAAKAARSPLDGVALVAGIPDSLACRLGPLLAAAGLQVVAAAVPQGAGRAASGTEGAAEAAAAAPARGRSGAAAANAKAAATPIRSRSRSPVAAYLAGEGVPASS